MFGKLLSYIPGTASYKERYRSEGASEAVSGLNDMSLRQFESAMENRRRPFWNHFNLFENPEMFSHDLPIVRHRSRLLYRNDATARGIINKDVANVIGPGFSVQSRIPKLDRKILGISDDRAKELNEKAEDYFRERIINSKSYSIGGELDYFQLVKLKYKTYRMDGEMLCSYRMRQAGDLPFCCEIIPVEKMKDPLNFSKSSRAGVEFGANGMVKGYWVEEKAYTHKFNLLPVRNRLGLPATVHYFSPEQAGFTRGLPWLTAALLLINDKSDYMNSELQTKIIEADVALVIESEKPGEMQEAMSGSTLAGGSSTSKEYEKVSNWPRKQVLYLNKGEAVKPVEWTRPGTTFEPFINQINRAIGNAIGRSFEFVSNNYGAANFSATRVSGIEDSLEFLCEFNMFANNAITPDWQWAMWAASLELGEPLLMYCKPDWQKYIKQSWDELKDAKAATEKINNGTSNVIIESAKIGNDNDTVLAGKIKAEKNEQEARASAGLQEEVTEDDSSENPATEA